MAGAQDVVDQNDLLARARFEKLPKPNRLIGIVLLRPVDLVGTQRFAYAIGDGQSGGSRRNDRQCGIMARISGCERNKRLRPTVSIL